MNMPFFYGMDPVLAVISLACLALSLIAQGLVKAAFARYSRVANSRNLSGAEAARLMLSAEGVAGVRINRYAGSWLSDHYDPSARVVNLSPDVYDGHSVAAVGIACHEAGHALQHAHRYAFLGLRSLLVPTAGLGSKLGIPLILIGLALGSLGLAKAGLILFGTVFLFQLITLPVELDASARSKRALVAHGVVGTGVEARGVSAVLNAAALTYVAAAIASLVELLYWAYRLGLLGGRRNSR
ncbi:MAG: zinc metallopeptidase [Planctomycetota bacterium]|jgi:Zn-dependent membrane protease YugP|nr:zinc metallopeptidase [Planctomycetota bacterium]